MTPELIFSVANVAAAAAWIALVVLPNHHPLDVITGRIVPAIFAVLYVVIVASVWGRAEGGFGSLDGVAALFENRWMLLAGWLHYLAFDLLIGAWEVRDARRRGVPSVLLVPCLIATFMFGPAGWLLYLAARARRSGGAAPIGGGMA